MSAVPHDIIEFINEFDENSYARDHATLTKTTCVSENEKVFA